MPARAKRFAWTTLAVSWAFTAAILGPLSLAALISGACIAGVAIYIAHIPVIEANKRLLTEPLE